MAVGAGVCWWELFFAPMILFLESGLGNTDKEVVGMEKQPGARPRAEKRVYCQDPIPQESGYNLQPPKGTRPLNARATTPCCKLLL